MWAWVHKCREFGDTLESAWRWGRRAYNMYKIVCPTADNSAKIKERATIILDDLLGDFGDAEDAAIFFAAPPALPPATDTATATVTATVTATATDQKWALVAVASAIALACSLWWLRKKRLAVKASH